MAADSTASELEAELGRRSAILEAVRHAAERFLDPGTSWEDHLPGVLADLARATGTSRVYLFENYQFDEDGEVWSTQRFEWSAPGVRSIRDDVALAALPLRRAGLGRWVDTLERGEVVTGLRREMRPSEQPQLEADDTLAIALVPILLEDRFWGMLGFDECAYERQWSAGELDGLRTAAGTIAAAIHAELVDAELRAREAEYRAVFDATGDGLIICDLDGRVAAANPAFCAIYGEGSDVLVGSSFSTVIRPYGRSPEEYLRSVTDGVVFTTDASVEHREGGPIPVEIRGSRLLFGGEPHLLVVVRDVTERARMRALLELRVGALTSVAESLTVDQPVEVTLTGLCAVLVEATDAVASSVQLIDAQSEAVQMVGQHGLPESYPDALEQVLEHGVDTPVTQALRDQEELLVSGARQAALEIAEWKPLHRPLTEATWSDVLVVPLDALGRHIGALNLYYPAGSEPDEAERSFFRAIADQAAAAVENARLYHAAQHAAALEERQRLARELHDSVSQALYGIGLGARTALSLAEQDPARVRQPMEYVLELAEVGLAEMRALIFELRPEALANEGLVAALDRQLRALRARRELEVTSELGEEPQLAIDTKQALYRIAQEALINIVKHAEADSVRVVLDAEQGGVRLTVADDGVGFDPGGTYHGHLGLRTMRERAEGSGGSVELVSAPGAGTTLTVTVPPGASES